MCWYRSDEESTVQIRAHSAGMVPACFGQYRAAQTSPQTVVSSPIDSRSWRNFWVSLSLFSLDVKTHFLEFVVRRALEEICSPDACITDDASLSVADALLRPFPRLRSLVVSIAYGRVRDDFARVERLVSTLGKFDGSHRAARRSPCLPSLYDFCADLYFRIEFSNWCSRKLSNGDVGRNSRESKVATPPRRAWSDDTQRAIFEGLETGSVPFLLRAHVDSGVLPRDDLLLRLERRPTNGIPRPQLDSRLRDLDVLRHFFVLRAVRVAVNASGLVGWPSVKMFVAIVTS